MELREHALATDNAQAPTIALLSQLGPALSTKLNHCVVHPRTTSVVNRETLVFVAVAHVLLATSSMLTPRLVKPLNTTDVKETATTLLAKKHAKTTV
jgi:hypothetical protein